MPEVFLNYRTGDGEAAAALTDSLLSSRFGAGKIFFAHRSLEPGTRFPAALIDARYFAAAWYWPSWDGTGRMTGGFTTRTTSCAGRSWPRTARRSR